MSDLSYLDTISNKDLHKQCLAYGLPNIPVTDSSRQVLVRRLRATILGVPLNKSKNAAATKKTLRRETVHGSKATPATELSTSNARVAAKSPSRNNNSRRTIAATPSNYYPLDNVSVRSVETTTTVSDVGSQSEDDDYNRAINAATQRSIDERRRRSVSLTKSGVLTTSYTREVDHQPHYDEAEEPQSYTYQRPVVAPAHTQLPSYKPHVERIYGSGLARLGLTQSQLNSTSYAEHATGYNDPMSMRQAPRNAYSGSTAPFNSDAATTSSIRQRQRIESNGVARGRLLQPTFAANTLYPELQQFYDEQDNHNTVEPMDAESESEPEFQEQQRSHRDTIESPYLSHFSRELGAGKRSSPLARPQKRATLAQQHPDSVKQQFLTFIRSVDRQYHLKFYVFLAVAVVLATLVYVVLTP